MTDPIEVYLQDYLAITAGLPPLPIPAGPVHPGGASPVDATMAAFGSATNADLPQTNTDLTDDHRDRAGHAGDAAQKFATHEDEAVSQFQDVAAQGDATMAQQAPQDAMGGATQGLTGALEGITGALSGVLGSAGKLPQELMQAGQGALSPLMGAAQSLGKSGVGDAALASDVDPDPALGGGDFGSGTAGGGLGMGTTPAGNLGPPPLPTTAAPTTPTGSMAATGSTGPTGGGPAASGAGGGGMMPMMPGGAGAGGKGGKDDTAGEKRIAAPGVANGQPVKGRTTVPPNIPVTKSVAKDGGQPGLTPLKHIVEADEPSK